MEEKIPLASYKNPPSPLVKGESHLCFSQQLIKNFNLEFRKSVWVPVGATPPY
jgi:hypothetical protein